MCSCTVDWKLCATCDIPPVAIEGLFPAESLKVIIYHLPLHLASTTGAGHLPSNTGAGHLPSITGAGYLPSTTSSLSPPANHRLSRTKYLKPFGAHVSSTPKHD